MTVEQKIDEPSDRFPVGMRVLAVDDDPTCLRLLDSLLRKCQYHVTTTNQAITALKMLRENKHNFDLVISDVHMPDMDGFKLLELVGLEMDLPVIMLSANGDTRLVMKGITHGACDYLLKPIRIEELKNIWQHVIRRKKFDSNDRNDSDKSHRENGGGQGLTGVGDSDQNGKLNRKRKDQNEDEDEENDENGHNNEDSSTQKKPRVVWSMELHRKFVAVVNQLGIEKAVPKRILDLMNVEKLTRENVASHLQKYRLYLKRISCVANQQAHMVAALGGTDYSFSHMGYLNGIGNNRSLARPGQFQNSSLKSFSSPSGMLGRLNSPDGLATRGLSSSGLVQIGHGQNSNNLVDDPNKFHPILVPGHRNGNILHGLPMSSQELAQVQQNNGVTHLGDLSTTSDDSVIFPVTGSFSDTKTSSGDSRNTLLEGHREEFQKRGVFGNQSSAIMPSLNAKFPSHLQDYGRCNDNWQGAVQSVENNSSMMHIGHNPHDISLITSGLDQLLDSRTDLHSQVAPVGNNVGQNMTYVSRQGWDDRIDEASHHSGSMNSLTSSHGVLGTFPQSFDQNDTICHRNHDFNLIEQSNFVDPIPMQHNNAEQFKQRYLMEQRKPQGSYEYSKVHSLEDLVSAIFKEDQDKLVVKEADFGVDSFSIGTCM